MCVCVAEDDAKALCKCEICLEQMVLAEACIA